MECCGVFESSRSGSCQLRRNHHRNVRQRLGADGSVVRSFVKEAEGNVLVIDVATPTGSFKVRVPNYQGEFPMYLEDAKVRFRGVCGTAFNRRDQLVGIHLFMPTLENAEVVEAAPLDPFGVP